MKNQKKQKLNLKKLTITNLKPDIIARLKGGDCPPTEIHLDSPSGNPCYVATGDPCCYPD